MKTDSSAVPGALVEPWEERSRAPYVRATCPSCGEDVLRHVTAWAERDGTLYARMIHGSITDPAPACARVFDAYVLLEPDKIKVGRIVYDPEEAMSLPERTVVVDANNDVFVRRRTGFEQAGVGGLWTTAWALYPARVIHVGSE
jgi:hypothetical protein